jgi:hypothetical protein
MKNPEAPGGLADMQKTPMCEGTALQCRRRETSSDDSSTMSDATRGLSFMTSAQQSWDEYWLPSDLFFLRDALGHGMTFAEVAGFLSRDEDEVRKKAKQMKRLHSCHRGLRRGA